MKANKTKISIGIPAYNEEKNIQNVLKGILSQKKDTWELREIIVICDGCTDKTATKARQINNKKILVFDDSLRKGKTKRLQELFNLFTGDILVMFDSDITFSSTSVISSLIKPFILHPNTMLVGGNSKPFKPNSFVERAVYSTFNVFYKSRLQVKGGNNIFGATGSILAIRKKLAKKLKLPNIISEDAYIYLECIKRGFDFKYVDTSIVFYKTPSNFKDYIKQLFRSNPESVDSELNRFFGSLVKKEFYRPMKFYIPAVLNEFVHNPLGVISIVTINLLCRPFHGIVMKNYKIDWFTAHSTH